MSDSENKEPSIGQIKVQTGDSNSGGFAKGLLAGSSLKLLPVVISSIVCGAIGLVLGFYWHVQLVKEREAKVDSIIEEHAALKSENDDLKDANIEILNQSLSDLGFKDSEILDLKGEKSYLTNLVRSLKTKSSTTVVNECDVTDYSDKTNAAISELVKARARNNE